MCDNNKIYKYPSQHPDVVRARNKAYREKNREKLRQYDANRYEKRYQQFKIKIQNDLELKTQVRERNYEWRRKNPERWKALTKRWRDKNPNYVAPSDSDKKRKNELWRRAYAKRAEYYRMKSTEKRARKASVPGSHTMQEWLALVEYFGGCCAYCGTPGKLTRDHVIPLSRHELSPTNYIGNILPACPSCNFRKKNKTDWEFRKWLFDTGAPLCLRNA